MKFDQRDMEIILASQLRLAAEQLGQGLPVGEALRNAARAAAELEGRQPHVADFGASPKIARRKKGARP